MPAPLPWADLPPATPGPGPAASPSPQQPLAGLTLLLVEDSRFASDALRLVAHRAGARLRRAETLAGARHHLQTYRPDLVIVDLGLPDGRGEDLIAELLRQGGPPVLAISGEDDGLARARRAGAAGFQAKPLGSIAAICRALLALLPERGWLSPALPDGAAVEADPLALRDDLAEAARRLSAGPRAGAGAGQTGPAEPDGRDYISGFVTGLARSSHDTGLEDAAWAAREGPQAAGPLARAIAERLRPPGPLVAAPR